MYHEMRQSLENILYCDPTVCKIVETSPGQFFIQPAKTSDHGEVNKINPLKNDIEIKGEAQVQDKDLLGDVGILIAMLGVAVLLKCLY